jgi:hypothetical protein
VHTGQGFRWNHAGVGWSRTWVKSGPEAVVHRGAKIWGDGSSKERRKT